MRALHVVPAAVALCLAMAAFPDALRSADRPLLGFSPEAAAAQRALEARFDEALQADNLRAWHKRLAARPHPVGSPYGRENAEFLLGLFRSWGYDARIETFDVLFPTPRTRVLEMTAPTRWKAAPDRARAPGGRDVRARPPSSFRATTRTRSTATWRASSSTSTTACPPTTRCSSATVSTSRARSCIARYGGSWRGIKPKVAAEHGAHRLPRLLGPARRRLLPGRRLPEGPVAHGARARSGARSRTCRSFPAIR